MRGRRTANIGADLHVLKGWIVPIQSRWCGRQRRGGHHRNDLGRLHVRSERSKLRGLEERWVSCACALYSVCPRYRGNTESKEVWACGDFNFNEVDDSSFNADVGTSNADVDSMTNIGEASPVA